MIPYPKAFDSIAQYEKLSYFSMSPADMDSFWFNPKLIGAVEIILYLELGTMIAHMWMINKPQKHRKLKIK